MQGNGGWNAAFNIVMRLCLPSLFCYIPLIQASSTKPLPPQTIPFVAELLEDPEHAVEARAQQLVALLEEISGEKLDQYLK